MSARCNWRIWGTNAKVVACPAYDAPAKSVSTHMSLPWQRIFRKETCNMRKTSVLEDYSRPEYKSTRLCTRMTCIRAPANGHAYGQSMLRRRAWKQWPLSSLQMGKSLEEKKNQQAFYVNPEPISPICSTEKPPMAFSH